MQFSRFLLFSLLAAAPCAQTSRNVALLSMWKSPTNAFQSYSDVWGYHDPDDGREIAVIGSYEGIHFIDCTDPRNPTELKSFLTPVQNSGGNTWRDFKTYGHHVYEVSEAYGGTRIFGIKAQIPVLKAWWGQNQWGNAHNIGMDRDTGIAYVSGTNRGVIMFDCSQNPANPTYLGRLASPYMHDLAVQDGYGYFCDQNGNNLRIYDVTNAPNLVQLSSTRQPGSGIAHNCWPSRDGQICVTTNETNLSPMGVFDVSNKNLPRLLSTWRPNPQASNLPHNAYIRDYVAHLSYYVEGYRAVDLSDPANPVEVGYYSARPGSAGAWGCYHEQPSGVIYIGDIGDGLLVMKPTATTVLFGAGTAGGGGMVPEIHTRGAAYKGSPSFALEVERARPNSPAALFLSPNRQSVSLQGLNLHVDLGPGLINVPIMTDGSGCARLPRPIAANAADATLYVQALVIDPGSASPLGLSATQGMELQVFSL